MDSLTTTDKSKEIAASKRRFGLTYGIITGLAFALALFGYDAYLLWQHHAYFPWAKLSGALLFMIVGGLAGWLTARFEKSLLGMLFWFAASLLFTSFTVIVPFLLAPRVQSLLDPSLASLLNYTFYDDLPSRGILLFIWITIFLGVVAVVQLPLIEQAVFSTTSFGKYAPFLLACVLMLIAGTISDDMNNLPLRDPIIQLDNTIQFWLDTRGTEVDRKTVRDMHLTALRTIEPIVSNERLLAVSSFDDQIGFVHIVVNFDGEWVDCVVVYSQPSTCKSLAP